MASVQNVSPPASGESREKRGPSSVLATILGTIVDWFRWDPKRRLFSDENSPASAAGGWAASEDMQEEVELTNARVGREDEKNQNPDEKSAHVNRDSEAASSSTHSANSSDQAGPGDDRPGDMGHHVSDSNANAGGSEEEEVKQEPGPSESCFYAFLRTGALVRFSYIPYAVIYAAFRVHVCLYTILNGRTSVKMTVEVKEGPLMIMSEDSYILFEC